jgi:hypothetical protein
MENRRAEQVLSGGWGVGTIGKGKDVGGDLESEYSANAVHTCI